MRVTFLSILTLFLAILPFTLAQGQFGNGQGGQRGPGQRQGQGGRGGNRGFGGRPNGNGGGGGRGGNGNANAPPTTLATVNGPPPPAATGGAGNGNNNGGGGGGAINAALIPPYGVTAGISANDGTGNCLGLDNKAIPCDCPPAVNDLAGAIQQQVAGGASFPTGNSVQDQLTRLGTAIVALQNVKGGPGSGVGCPAVSTNWNGLRERLQGQL